MRKFRDKDLQEWVDMLRARTQRWFESHSQGGLHFAYWGEIDGEDKVYLFGSNDSYSPLYARARTEHIKNGFRKIKNLEWNLGSYSGYGDGQWLELNIGESTPKALKAAYVLLHDDRGRSYLSADGSDDSESWVYDAMDTEEYRQMEDEESNECYNNWLRWDVLRSTPYEDLPESYYRWFDDFIYQEESGGGYIYNQGKGVIEVELMAPILEALNAGDLEVDQEDYEEFIADEKNQKWPRIRQGKDEKWYLASEMTFWNDEWVAPFKTETKRMWDDGIGSP